MKIYQLRCQEGHSEDFWPKATTTTFEACLEAYRNMGAEEWSCDDEESAEFRAVKLTEDAVNKHGIAQIQGPGDYFIHVIEVTE